MAKLRVSVDKLIADKVGEEYYAYLLKPTTIAQDPARDVIRKDEQTLALRNLANKAEICTVKLSDLRTLADNIDRSTYYGSYRDIKNDGEWKSLYDQRTTTVRVKFEDTWKFANAEVIPCYYCGFATPLGMIEVDHWFEKGDDTERIQALLKIFRALGNQLTQGDATGSKAAQVQAIMNNGVITALDTRNSGPTLADGVLNHKRKKFTDAKRKLTDKGQLVLSGFYAAWNNLIDQKTFLKLFYNNFFNLVPACGACNKAKNHR